MDAAAKKASTDAPPGLIPVRLKGAVLLLTALEFEAAIHRGKAWRRRLALLQREAIPIPRPVVASAGEPREGS
jgi:hypothetical protein